MPEITIRPAVPEDLTLLTQLARETFYEKWMPHNTPEDMATYLAEAFSKERMRAELEDPAYRFWIAWVDGEPAGYAKTCSAHEEPQLQGRHGIEIERVYLYRRFQRMGLGDRLMQLCLDYAEAEGYEVAWLGVWEQNLPAMAFYKRWGFEVFGAHIFKLGEAEDEDLLLWKTLTPSA